MNEKFRIIELFGGIGACTQALKSLLTEGGKFLEIVDYVEIDKYAVKSYNAINETQYEPQDITQWNKHFENIDLIMHGSPCQDFSLAGKQAGGDEGSGTKSSLMYETIRIVKNIMPKYVIWENVKNLISSKHIHNFSAYIDAMQELGYHSYYKVLNAKDYGVPQNRERIFTISIRNDINKNFEFPEPFELTKRLKDVLEDDVDDKYYIDEEHLARIAKWKSFQNPLDKVLGMNAIVPTITTRVAESDGGGISASAKFIDENYDGDYINIRNATKKGYIEAHNYDSVNLAYPNSETRRGRVGFGIANTLQCNDNMGVIVPPLKIRKLTPLECWRLMGFSDECFIKAKCVNTNPSLYKQAGNSIVVNVLYEIFKKLLED